MIITKQSLLYRIFFYGLRQLNYPAYNAGHVASLDGKNPSFYNCLMNMQYTTDRLILRIEDGSIADEVLDFFVRNRDFFAPSEPVHSADFYKKSHMEALLDAEYKGYLRSSIIRYWIYLRSLPGQIIGTVSFSHIYGLPYSSCEIGYRLDKSMTGCGYAREAISATLDALVYEFAMHRVTAMIMPDNTPSIRLAEKLGFQYEGLCRKYAMIGDSWRDHYIYSKIFDDPYS